MPVFDEKCLRILAGVVATHTANRPLAYCRIRTFDPIGPAWIKRMMGQVRLNNRLQNGNNLTKHDEHLLEAIRKVPDLRVPVREMVQTGTLEALEYLAYGRG